MLTTQALGRVSMQKGEILTLVVDDPQDPGRYETLTLLALCDINLSQELVGFYRANRKQPNRLRSERALSAFAEYLQSRKLAAPTQTHVLTLGQRGRPASRILDEYKFHQNPAQFAIEYLMAHYRATSLNLYNHQGRYLLVLAGSAATDQLTANLLDETGETLGCLQLEIITDQPNTQINADDLQALRLAIQADITAALPDITIMVDTVHVHPGVPSDFWIKE